MTNAAEQPMIAIEARDIAKSFGTAQVLKGISLSAQQGDVIAIVSLPGPESLSDASTWRGRCRAEVSPGREA